MARLPTEREAAILRDMYREYRSRGNTLPKSDSPVQRDETFFGVFETPAGGIPAMADDVPGEADCIVYWYDIDGDGVIEAVGDGTETETVCNRFETSVPASTKIFAARDPWGTWWYFANQSGCDNPPPGVYQGVSGGAIAGGASGTVLVGEDEYTAKNQSNCAAEFGDLLFVGVDNDCNVFFTPCKCCTETEDCCNGSIAICICGTRKIVALNGGTAEFDVSDCCECEGATLTITMSCETVEEVSTITMDWDYECGETTDSGSEDLSDLCSDSNVVLEDVIEVSGCTFNDKYANFLMDCETIVGECDVTTLTLTEYDDSYVPNGSGTVDMDSTASTLTITDGEILTVTQEFTNNTDNNALSWSTETGGGNATVTDSAIWELVSGPTNWETTGTLTIGASLTIVTSWKYHADQVTEGDLLTVGMNDCCVPTPVMSMSFPNEDIYNTDGGTSAACGEDA